MPYICYCKDHPESTTLRVEHKPPHLRYIESILDHILVAGPLYDSASKEQNGSFYVFDVDTEEEVRAFLQNDPYHNAGIFTEVTLQPFQPVAGTWVGGKTW